MPGDWSQLCAFPRQGQARRRPFTAHACTRAWANIKWEACCCLAGNWSSLGVVSRLNRRASGCGRKALKGGKNFQNTHLGSCFAHGWRLLHCGLPPYEGTFTSCLSLQMLTLPFLSLPGKPGLTAGAHWQWATDLTLGRNKHIAFRAFLGIQASLHGTFAHMNTLPRLRVLTSEPPGDFRGMA